ncbi:MAG: DUF4249 domain-containing protein [Bacteroidia bacterium]|nr:DUF4249 domain-containing protein [Bacteroidia bacterium]
MRPNILKISAVQLLLVLLVFAGCEKNVTVDIPRASEELVVEGYIEAGGSPVLVLSRTLPFFGTIHTNGFIQNTVTGAVVIVSDGSVTDTLSQVPGYGVYYSGAIIGQTGKTYTLHIDVEGKTLTASTFMPAPVPLDSVWWKVDGNRDSLGFVWAHLTDPDTLGNAYRWFAKRINVYTYGELKGQVKDTTFYAPEGGSVFEDKFINGKSFDLSFLRGHAPYSQKEDDTNDEAFFYKRGDTIVVKFSTIDRNHFEFWRTEETQVSNNGNPFASPAPVTSNIHGGLGIWGAYNSTYDTVFAQ